MNLDMVIPIAVHGDEADSHRRRSFSILTFYSLTTSGTIFENKFLTYCLDNSVATETTASTLERWVAHSLSELQEGFFSQVDPWGQDFPRKNRSGPICDGWKFIVAMVKGDEKWHQRAFRTTKSWVSRDPCIHCGASSAANSGELLYTSFGPLAGHRSTLRSTTTFVSEVCQMQVWTTIPGFNLSMVCYDWLHVTDLCIVPECGASALKLALTGVWTVTCMHVDLF